MKELLGEKPMPTSKVTQLVPQSFLLEPASQIIPMAPRPHTPLPTPPNSVASTLQNAMVPHERLKKDLPAKW